MLYEVIWRYGNDVDNIDLIKKWKAELLHIIPPGTRFTEAQKSLDPLYEGADKMIERTRLIMRIVDKNSILILPLSRAISLTKIGETNGND